MSHSGQSRRFANVAATIVAFEGLIHCVSGGQMLRRRACPVVGSVFTRREARLRRIKRLMKVRVSNLLRP